jgi:FG-GAP-like repeat
MSRTACRPSLVTFILAAALAVTAFVSAHARVVHPGASAAVASAADTAPAAEDASDKASPLMVMGDFNRDGINDIAEVVLPVGDHSVPGSLKVSLGRADGSFKEVSSGPVLGPTPKEIVAGDFNQDGIPDVIVGDDDGALMLFLGDGTGNMVRAADVAHLDSVVSIAVADFNHDGIPDLAVSDWRASTVTVLLGAGKGSFRSAGSFPLRMPGTTPHLASADFNGDGIPDLAVVYDDDEGATFDVMLGNGNGGFTVAPRLGLVRDPNSHCVT